MPYTDCSTTNGVLSLDPYELRLNNITPSEIYGNGGQYLYFSNLFPCLSLLFSERYNYDASVAFDYATFPVTR